MPERFTWWLLGASCCNLGGGSPLLQVAAFFQQIYFFVVYLYLFILRLKLFSSFICFTEGSQFFGGLPSRTQNKSFCLNTFSGPWDLIVYAVSAPLLLCQNLLR